MICGERKTSTCGVDDLVCDLEAGHDPAFHGVCRGAGMPTFIRWGPSIVWTAEDAARQHERYSTWSKGHVRRDYQSASQAKAMLEHQNAVAELKGKRR